MVMTRSRSHNNITARNRSRTPARPRRQMPLARLVDAYTHSAWTRPQPKSRWPQDDNNACYNTVARAHLQRYAEDVAFARDTSPDGSGLATMLTEATIPWGVEVWLQVMLAPFIGTDLMPRKDQFNPSSSQCTHDVQAVVVAPTLTGATVVALKHILKRVVDPTSAVPVLTVDSLNALWKRVGTTSRPPPRNIVLVGYTQDDLAHAARSIPPDVTPVQSVAIHQSDCEQNRFLTPFAIPAVFDDGDVASGALEWVEPDVWEHLVTKGENAFTPSIRTVMCKSLAVLLGLIAAISLCLWSAGASPRAWSLVVEFALCAVITTLLVTVVTQNGCMLALRQEYTRQIYLSRVLADNPHMRPEEAEEAKED